MPEFVIDKRFTTRVERTPRVLQCAEAFGIGLDEKEFLIYDQVRLEVRQGDVVYITGQSGSGKSLLLRELEVQMRAEGKVVLNIADIQFDERPLIEQLGGSMQEAAERLAQCGLNDAYLFVRRPSELSDGQRYRFRLALAVERQAQVIVADEFGAVLDRTTATVVAFCMQKVARRMGATLIVATTHTDLEHDLNPTLVVHKEFEERIRVLAHPERRAPA